MVALDWLAYGRGWRVRSTIKERDDRLPVDDLAAVDHGEGFVPGEDQVFDFLVGFAAGRAGCQIACDVNVIRSLRMPGEA